MPIFRNAFSLALIAAAFFPVAALAHELWILTPDQAIMFNQRPKPAIFTGFTPEGAAIIAAFTAVIGVVFYLYYNNPFKAYDHYAAPIYRLSYWAPTVMRFCTAWALISGALGAEPRFGNEAFQYSTMLGPDLTLAAAGPQWMWLADLQLFMGLGLILGVYTRLIALLIFFITMLGIVIFGMDAFIYAPVWYGVGAYFLIRGAGPLALKAPTPIELRWLATKLERGSPKYIHLILRLLVGFNFLSLGLYFKVMQPNLAAGIIETYQVPILSLAPESFTFIMALVETIGGLLILIGVFQRPIALFLMGAFLFFAMFLPETYTSHMILYGVMFTFITERRGMRGFDAFKQSGRRRRERATDWRSPANA